MISVFSFCARQPSQLQPVINNFNLVLILVIFKNKITKNVATSIAAVGRWFGAISTPMSHLIRARTVANGHVVAALAEHAVKRTGRD